MTFESIMPEDVRLIFLRVQTELLPIEALPDTAAELLIRGYDSPALRELAGHPRNDPRGARDLWLMVRDELGVPYMDDAEARWILMREWMSRIVDGTLDPVEGARLILRHGWIELRQPVELGGLVALLDDWDDMPSWRGDTKERIVADAREILNGPSGKSKDAE